MDTNTEIVTKILFIGSSFMIFVAVYFICFTYLSIRRRNKDKNTYLNSVKTLTTEIISLEKKLYSEMHAHKDVTEKYLFFLVDLFNAIDKNELVIITNSKNSIESNLLAIYESIQKELQMISYNLYAENSQGLPFNSAVNGFIKLHSKVMLDNNKVQFYVAPSDKAIDYTNLFSIIKMINIASQEDVDLLVINDEKVLFNKKVSDNSLTRLKAMSLVFNYKLIETDDYIEVVF